MDFKIIFSQLNIISQCKKRRLSLRQCPQFVFLIIGTIIIASTLLVFFIGLKLIVDPLIVAIICIILTIFLLALNFIITQSFDRLAEVAKMRSDFIGIISHQLKTPLSILKWTIEILMSRNLEKDKKEIEHFNVLKENVNRMTELLNDLIMVSRIEEGDIFEKKEEFSLLEITEKTIKKFIPFAEAQNVKINLAVENNLPLIWADSFQIKQVIENLLSNAIRYMPFRNSKAKAQTKTSKQKREIKINLFCQGKNIFFQIKDQGIGIPKEEQRYVFKKFFRTEEAKKHNTQGSGLGLFIAQSILEKAGGKIWFKSEQKKGTIFYFSLPIK